LSLARLRQLAHRVLALRTVDHRPPIRQWEDRAQRFGVRAALNLGHSEEEIPRVTERQRRELYPLFRAALRGDERLVLDFGCGPGRFTGELARMITGRAIGVDPIQHLLDLAPLDPRVEYRLMSEGQIPLESGSVDAVWICLVLGGIHGGILGATIRELCRVLKPSGLLFLVENTTNGKGNAFWTFRSVAAYQNLLAPVPLEHIHDYHDLNERISVMRGRNP
jgi:SAM-dependent methyltransferase